MRPPLSSKGRTVTIANAPSATSELDHICSGFSISNRLLIILGESIKDLKDFSTSVTLCQQRKHHGLGHNEEEKCSKLLVGSL